MNIQLLFLITSLLLIPSLVGAFYLESVENPEDLHIAIKLIILAPMALLCISGVVLCVALYKEMDMEDKT